MSAVQQDHTGGHTMSRCWTSQAACLRLLPGKLLPLLRLALVQGGETRVSAILAGAGDSFRCPPLRDRHPLSEQRRGGPSSHSHPALPGGHGARWTAHRWHRGTCRCVCCACCDTYQKRVKGHEQQHVCQVQSKHTRLSMAAAPLTAAASPAGPHAQLDLSISWVC